MRWWRRGRLRRKPGLRWHRSRRSRRSLRSLLCLQNLFQSWRGRLRWQCRGHRSLSFRGSRRSRRSLRQLSGRLHGPDCRDQLA